MKGSEAHTDLIDQAALYALGALTQDEARSFEEHLEEGCDICGAEVAAFGEVVAALSFGVREEAPSPEVKNKLRLILDEEQRAENDGRASAILTSQFLSVRANEGEWLEVQEGILVKQMFIDNKTGIATSLVRMMPGTSLPRHRHGKAEQFYVLEGDCHVQGEVLGPGDYHCAVPGSIHATTYTVGGTLLLLVAPERYEVLQDN
jgi:quercetin dioxygenase-like cupin family protein